MRKLWNEKFSRDGLLYGEHANKFIQESFTFVKDKNLVLCLGEGEGRNALFLAKKGLHVEALDASDIGLNKLQKRAQQENLDIKTHHTLLENWQSKQRYDAIICTYMHLPKSMQKSMFNKIIDLIEPGGFFIAEFFSEDQLKYKSGGPKNIDLLYSLDFAYKVLSKYNCEIVKLSQEVVYLNEGKGHNGNASVIRIVVRKTKLI